MKFYPKSLLPIPDSTVQSALDQLHMYIETSVPIYKTSQMPPNATGAFVHHLKDPWSDYILIPDDLPPYLELIVLAHELGHLENSRFDNDRFSTAMIMTIMYKKHGHEIGTELIVEEEMLANKRGRLHIKELIPDLLVDYDIAMEVALDVYRRRGWIKASAPHYEWLA